MKMVNKLTIIETHPIQYHAPVYRTIQNQFGIPVTAIYGSDFSVAGYHDAEFDTTFAWDTDLLAGYKSLFLSRVKTGGASSVEEVSAQGLHEALQEVNPSAVLLVGFSPRFHQQAFWYGWRGGYPLLFRGETTDHGKVRGAIKRRVRDYFLRWFYRQCSVLLYVGQHSFTHYRRLGVPENKLVFSPYCVDNTAFQAGEKARGELRKRTRKELGVGEDRVVILFSGKLIPRKAPGLILKAVKQFSPDIRNRLVTLFLGDGQLREPLEELARTSPRIQARFVGFQNQRLLSGYYHAADILALPSHYESWGLVVNEALHHGVPCVVSNNVGCTPDLIESGITGEIFKPGSVQSLRSALETAMKLVGQSEVRKWCRQKVGNYTIEKAAEGIAKAYWTVTKHPTQA